MAERGRPSARATSARSQPSRCSGPLFLRAARRRACGPPPHRRLPPGGDQVDDRWRPPGPACTSLPPQQVSWLDLAPAGAPCGPRVGVIAEGVGVDCGRWTHRDGFGSLRTLRQRKLSSSASLSPRAPYRLSAVEGRFPRVPWVGCQAGIIDRHADREAGQARYAWPCSPSTSCTGSS